MADDTDPRVARTRAAVLEATRDLLVEIGIERTGIEAVSDRSGVARSTIYRHWDGKASLVLEALNAISDTTEDISTGDALTDLRAMVRGLGVKLRSEWSAALGEVQAGAERDPELATLHEAFVTAKRKASARLIGVLQEAGVIRDDLDPLVVGEIVVGRLFYRRFVMLRPMSDEEVDDHLDLVFDLFTPR